MTSPIARTKQLVARVQQYRAVSFGMFVSKRYTSGQVGPLTAAFAYYWIFALPPLILLITMFAAAVNALTDVSVVEQLREFITDHVPEEMQGFLNTVVDQGIAQVGGGIASLGVIITAAVALWSASSAVGILLVGFNRAYAVEETRSYFRRRTLLILLTIALVVFINVAFILLIFGERIANWLDKHIDLSDSFLEFWDYARIPFALFCLAVIVVSLYWFGPNVRQPLRQILWGSAFTTLGLVILFYGFGLYIQFANPESAYGLVGGVILLLLLLKWAGMVFFLGAIINSIKLERAGGRKGLFLEGPGMLIVNQ